MDEPFYFFTYPDVASSGMSAGDHYASTGWREGRDPTPWFQASFYLAANPDVSAAGIEPFTHYLARGRLEGRPRRDPLTFNRELLRTKPQIAAEARQWVRPDARVIHSPAHVPLPEKEGAAAIVVLIGNDDFRRNVGGVQSCIAYEHAALARSGRVAFYAFPAGPLPVLGDHDPLLHVLIDGTAYCSIRSSALAELVSRAGREWSVPAERAVIHGLMGHDPEVLASQLREFDCPIDFWVHDYFAACTSYILSRNDLVACGGPAPSSNSCRVCSHGATRREHMNRMAAVLDLDSVVIHAPSEAAKQALSLATGWSGRPIQVLPHGRVAGLGIRLPTSRARPRIAFVGYPEHRKGWWTFLEMSRWAPQGGYDVVHIGRTPSGHTHLEFHDLADPIDGVAQTTSSLLDHDIDAVLVWPTWQETFSFVAYEAIAAGCLVITHDQSGNVLPAARSYGVDVTYRDTAQLRRAALTGELAERIHDFAVRERPVGKLLLDGLTPALLGRDSD